MKKRQVTGWYSMKQKPARPGVYQLQGYGDDYFSFWTGRRWNATDFTVHGAAEETVRSISCYNGQHTGWRGLTEPA